jgi:hypothetical protein
VLGEGDDVQVPLAVPALVAADQPGGVELGEIVLDLHRAALAAQRPELACDDGDLVAEAPLVVGLGEQAEEGPLGGQGHGCEGLRRERLGLDGADTGDVDRPPFEIRERGRESGGAGLRGQHSHTWCAKVQTWFWNHAQVVSPVAR